MIFIDEWLPNPVGPDANGEFVELWNNGNALTDLGGWTLRTDKKKFKLSGSIRANEYLVLPRSKTKLALKNTDGVLFLYDAAGKLVDQSTFVGSAPEGESFDRANYNVYDKTSIHNTIQQFVWGKPTPGAKNALVADIGIFDATYPLGIPLSPVGLNWFSVAGFALIAGVIFAAVLWYAVRHDDEISQLFFRRDEAIRP